MTIIWLQHHAQSNPFMWCFNVSLYSSIFFIQLQIKINARLFQMHLVSCPQASEEVHFVYRTEIYTNTCAYTRSARKNHKSVVFLSVVAVSTVGMCFVSPHAPPTTRSDDTWPFKLSILHELIGLKLWQWNQTTWNRSAVMMVPGNWSFID